MTPENKGDADVACLYGCKTMILEASMALPSYESSLHLGPEEGLPHLYV